MTPNDRSQPTLYNYGAINRADARRWFPAANASPEATITDLALGLAGESGEVVDLIKKFHRQGGEWVRGLYGNDELAAELADVFMYLSQLAVALGIDLHDEWEAKRALNEERFT